MFRQVASVTVVNGFALPFTKLLSPLPGSKKTGVGKREKHSQAMSFGGNAHVRQQRRIEMRNNARGVALRQVTRDLDNRELVLCIDVKGTMVKQQMAIFACQHVIRGMVDRRPWLKKLGYRNGWIRTRNQTCTLQVRSEGDSTKHALN